jgi:hypothetical protein
MSIIHHKKEDGMSQGNALCKKRNPHKPDGLWENEEE